MLGTLVRFQSGHACESDDGLGASLHCAHEAAILGLRSRRIAVTFSKVIHIVVVVVSVVWAVQHRVLLLVAVVAYPGGPRVFLVAGEVQRDWHAVALENASLALSEFDGTWAQSCRWRK